MNSCFLWISCNLLLTLNSKETEKQSWQPENLFISENKAVFFIGSSNIISTNFDFKSLKNARKSGNNSVKDSVSLNRFEIYQNFHH